MRVEQGKFVLTPSQVVSNIGTVSITNLVVNHTMSRKKQRRSNKPSTPKHTQKKGKLSVLLKEAEGCLPTAVAIRPIEEDLVLVEAGHFLDRKTRNRLEIARTALQGMENGSHLFGDDVLLSTQISYNTLTDSFLTQLVERNIPVRSERPFLFDYHILASYLPRQVKVHEFYNAFIELILNEWKINYARKLLVGFGFEEWGKQPTPEYYQIIRDHAAAYTDETLQTTLSLKTARGMWFASECIIRIRAQWDKLIDQLVFQGYFPERPSRTFDATLDKLEKNQDHEYLQTESQRECLKSLVILARQANRLKEWRDNDTHKFSETVFGVLEKPRTSQSLGTLWDMVVVEHNRVREALIAVIGMVVLTLQGPNAPILYCSGKWPLPSHSIDFENPEVVVKHTRLVQTIKSKSALRTATIQSDLSTKETALAQKMIDAAMGSEIHKLVSELFGCENNSSNAQE